MWKKISEGISAGILIASGGSVFLACRGMGNQLAGAVLFSVALLCICIKGYALYTGKVCYLLDGHDREAWSLLLLCLLGNTIATILLGWAVRYAVPSIGEQALAVCTSKLDQNFLQTLIRAILCGVMVYLSVSIYKEKDSVWGILFCIPTFIISGFEHSIADIFYFAASGMFRLDAFAFLMTVILGNSLGGLLLPALRYHKGDSK